MRYNKGKPTGEHVKYYADGQVQEKRRLINDVLQGAYYEYFPNGLVKTSGSYTSGNKTGTWT